MRGSGFKTNEVAGENLGNHNLVYRGVDGHWWLADADAAATMPVLGITMGSLSAGMKGEILLQGYIGDNTWTWVAGSEIYASTTPGELTQIAPVGAGDIVQVVAVAITSVIIDFRSGLGNEGLDEIVVRRNSGADVGPRPRLNFIEGLDITLTVTDDIVDNEIDITISKATLGEFFYKVADPDTNIGTHPAVLLPDNADTPVSDQILIPQNFTTLSNAYVVIVAAASGNMRRSAVSNWGAIGTESYVAANDAIVAGQVAVTVNILEAIDISTLFTGVAAGDLVGFTFTREGSDVNDTVNADCYYLGVLIRYV